MRGRRLRPGQRSEVWVASVDEEAPTLLFETTDLLVEAPNWSADGARLLLNGNGRLFSLAVDAPEGLVEVDLQGLPPINNDHVLAPGGDEVLLSALDGHLYVGPLAGGPVRRLSEEDGMLHYLHGVSPDGATLAYVAIPREGGAPGRLALQPATGGAGTIVDTGPGHIDGPEYSPDGEWILFNTEGFTTEPGHAQLARIPAAGGAPERLLESGTVDWFPHLSPDGRFATYLAFPAGTEGHPADLDVEVRLVSTDDWGAPLRRYPLFGGQGTLNVNSWAPDSRRFAFVAYPVATG
jgi:Tol biopolymer transport system component